MKTTQIFLYALLFLAAGAFFAACKKSESVEIPRDKQRLTLYLTDGPGFFDQVFVDMRSVQVLVDTTKDTRRNDTCNWDRVGAGYGLGANLRKDSGLVWANLNINPGVYDILNLRNGVDTLLSSTEIPKGAIRLIRIEIGTNNAVVKDSVTYPVSWPANVPNYILVKLKGHELEEFQPGQIRLWLDFDISRSIVMVSNNKFILRPVIHFFVVKQTASVSGKIKPMKAKPVITLFNNTDTAYALPDRDGNFKMRGLRSGTYSLYVNASEGYRDTTISNVVVQAPKNTHVSPIELRQ